MNELIGSIFTKGNEWYVIIAAFLLGGIYTLLKIGLKKIFKWNKPKPLKKTAKSKSNNSQSG